MSYNVPPDEPASFEELIERQAAETEHAPLTAPMPTEMISKAAWNAENRYVCQEQLKREFAAIGRAPAASGRRSPRRSLQ